MNHVRVRIKVICYDFALRNLTLEPHQASSSKNKELAEMIKGQWISYGFDVKLVGYNVLLSFPEKGKINGASLLDANGTVKFKTANHEEVLEPSERSPDVLPPFSAFSPTGKAKVGSTLFCFSFLINKIMWCVFNLSVILCTMVFQNYYLIQ